MTRLVVVSGKGGVGKSAVAAATALAAHRDGARVLALSMVGTGVDSPATPVPACSPLNPSKSSPDSTPSPSTAPRHSIEYLRVQIGLPPFAALPPVIRAFDALAAAAPAVREIVTVGKVLWEVKRDTGTSSLPMGHPPARSAHSYAPHVDLRTRHRRPHRRTGGLDDRHAPLRRHALPDRHAAGRTADVRDA
jgi:hypothetical protein